MTQIFLIMSGLSSCPDMDEIYGYVGTEAEADQIVKDLNDAKKPPHSSYSFFVRDVSVYDPLSTENVKL